MCCIIKAVKNAKIEVQINRKLILKSQLESRLPIWLYKTFAGTSEQQNNFLCKKKAISKFEITIIP